MTLKQTKLWSLTTNVETYKLNKYDGFTHGNVL